MTESSWLRAVGRATAYAVATAAVAFMALTTPMPLPLAALAHLAGMSA